MPTRDTYSDEPWLGGGGGTTAPTTSSQGNWWSNMSPQMQAALIGAGANIAGGYVQSREERGARREDNDAAMQRLELQLQMEREQRQRDLMQRQRELGLQAATQAPTRQDWRQHQALFADMLPGARNVSIQAPGGMQQFVPKISGGLRIPEGGFSQSALNFFTPEARAAAEGDLDRNALLASGGQYQTPRYSDVGYGAAGAQAQQGTTDYANQVRQQALQQTGQLGAMSPTAVARQTPVNTSQQTTQRPGQQQGPSMGSRIGNAALMAGMGYLGARYGGSPGGQQSNPWVSAALAGMGGFF